MHQFCDFERIEPEREIEARLPQPFLLGTSTVNCFSYVHNRKLMMSSTVGMQVKTTPIGIYLRNGQI